MEVGEEARVQLVHDHDGPLPHVRQHLIIVFVWVKICVRGCEGACHHPSLSLTVTHVCRLKSSLASLHIHVCVCVRKNVYLVGEGGVHQLHDVHGALQHVAEGLSCRRVVIIEYNRGGRS